MPVSLDFIPKRNAYTAIFTLPWSLRIFSDMPFCSLILACRFTERENTRIANNKMSSLLPPYNLFLFFLFSKGLKATQSYLIDGIFISLFLEIDGLLEWRLKFNREDSSEFGNFPNGFLSNGCKFFTS